MINQKEYLESVKSMRNHTKRLEREGDYWTQEERDKLVWMFNRGEGITEIAIQFQRTEPAVIHAGKERLSIMAFSYAISESVPPRIAV